jgi:hypothetical protein
MSKVYEHDVVCLGLSGRYYYCAKVEVLPNGMRKVIGIKRDVTASIEALLPKRRAAKKRRAKR